MECGGNVVNEFLLVLGEVEVVRNLAVRALTCVAGDYDDGNVLAAGLCCYSGCGNLYVGKD